MGIKDPTSLSQVPVVQLSSLGVPLSPAPLTNTTTMDIFSFMVDCIFLTEGVNLDPKNSSADVGNPVIQPFIESRKCATLFGSIPNAQRIRKFGSFSCDQSIKRDKSSQH